MFLVHHHHHHLIPCIQCYSIIAKIDFLLCRSRKWCTVVRCRTVMENDSWRSWKVIDNFYGNTGNTVSNFWHLSSVEKKEWGPVDVYGSGWRQGRHLATKTGPVSLHGLYFPLVLKRISGIASIGPDRAFAGPLIRQSAYCTPIMLAE